MNQKDLRIRKLLDRGLDLDQIVKKIGYGGNMEEGRKRVIKSLNK